MTTPTHIAVVDDHQLFREGVVELLQTVDGYTIIGQGGSGTEAITLARDLQPDVMLLDVEMPGPGAVSTIKEIQHTSPRTRVVILTMHDDADLIRELLATGASGYLLKSASRAELVAAIDTASRTDGTTLISVSRATLTELANPTTVEASPLSPRETEILTLIAGGAPNQEIAAGLYLSPGTVKRHIANIYNKLDVTSRIGAVRRAIELGIIPNTFTSPKRDRRR